MENHFKNIFSMKDKSIFSKSLNFVGFFSKWEGFWKKLPEFFKFQIDFEIICSNIIKLRK